MDQIRLSPETLTPEVIHGLFKRFDATNNNGILSLAEIDKVIMDMWPQNKKALMRAYKSADVSGDGFINENEFGEFLIYLAHYNALWEKFGKADSNDDGRISFEEFSKWYPAAMGKDAHPDTIKRDFESIDTNGGGFILFDEFCAFFAKKQTKIAVQRSPASQTSLGSNPQSSSASPAQSPVPVRTAKKSTDVKQSQKLASKATSGGLKSAPSLNVSTKFTPEQIHDLFEQFDANNHNGLLSLAEIDKAIMDLWPDMWKHKAAIMRAYKTSDLSDDGFINENEFGELLTYLAYYDKIYQEFSDMDTNSDKRVDFEEFKKAHRKLGSTQTDAQLKEEFGQIDLNGGGVIFFDEFCHYMAHKYGRPGNSKKSDLVSAPKVSKLPVRPGSSQKRPPSSSGSRNRPSSGAGTRAQPATGTKKLTPDVKFTPEQIHDLFERFDANNHNGLLSLAEIDKAIMDIWPDMWRHKAAVMRAYHTADTSNDGFITENEFGELLLYLAYYDKIFDLFTSMDGNSDKRLDFEEFKRGCELLGLTHDENTLRQEFAKIDVNGGGFILFDEFCHYMAHRFGRPGKSHNSDLISEQVKAKPAKAKSQTVATKSASKLTSSKAAASRERHQSTPGQKLTVDQKFTPEQIHDLFERFDANNHNGLLSLAEIDKAVMDLRPEMWRHKAALMRAYKASDVSNDGFITENEFGELLLYLGYYDKLYEIFSQLDYDHDKRVNFEEFKRGHDILGISGDEETLKREFEQIDSNGGGIILFDEFCHYMAMKHGRPGKSTKSDLITNQKAMYVVKGAPQSAAKSLRPVRVQKEIRSSAYSAAHPPSISSAGSSESRRDSVEHRIFNEQMERKRLERVVESLRHQLQQFTAGDDHSRQYLSGWEAMAEKNHQLSIKLEKEQKRNEELKHTMLEMVEKIKALEMEARRDFMEETKRSRGNQQLAMTREMRELKQEKAKFENLLQEMTAKYAASEERNTQLLEEIAMLKQQLGVAKSGSTKARRAVQ